MGFKTDAPERMTAIGYTRDYSADSVWSDIKAGELDEFSESPEFINYYRPDDWKVYKVTITIEPVNSADEV